MEGCGGIFDECGIQMSTSVNFSVFAVLLNPAILKKLAINIVNFRLIHYTYILFPLTILFIISFTFIIFSKINCDKFVQKKYNVL